MKDPTETALRQALQERGDSISPAPSLPRILHRAARTPAPRRRWLPAGVAALATAGLVTGAVLVLGPNASDDTAEVPAAQSSEPAGEAVAVDPGTEVPMALQYVGRYAGGSLVSGEFAVTSSGDVGVDAVRALMQGDPGAGFLNGWAGLNRDPEADPAQVESVTVTDELVSVDFSRFLGVTCAPGDRCMDPPADLTLQQLVHTLQSTLRTDAPVLLTVAGTPVVEAFGKPVDGPVAADPSVAPGIRVDAPEQGATVRAPVAVSGESTSFEGNVQWEARRGDEVVDAGFTTGGSMGEYAPFEVNIDLPPGDYTIALWEDNAAGGAEGLARRLSPVYVDVTVE